MVRIHPAGGAFHAAKGVRRIVKKPFQYRFQVGDTVYLYGRTPGTIKKQEVKMPGLFYTVTTPHSNPLGCLFSEGDLMSEEEYAAKRLAS